MQHITNLGWCPGGMLIVSLLVVSGCRVLPLPVSTPSAPSAVTPIPVVELVVLERAEVHPGETDRLVVTLHSPTSGPVRAVTVLSYPDGTQVTVQGNADGRPVELEWTVPADMSSGTARYDVVVSQVCGCGTAASATWGDARGTFRIAR